MQVKRKGGWEDIKCHASHAEAMAHLGALMTNVGEEAEKSADVELRPFAIEKLDEDQRLVFGWAYVAEVDGVDVVDHSGDVVGQAALEDLELAFYDYVLDSREADDMHTQLEGVGKLVECVVLTPAKAEAMGITTTRFGAWVGFKVQDDEAWAKVKRGDRRMFSIRGAGTREEMGDA
ncbi:MAG: XkdF-like putative serine protease domain-containing protein [Phycisphaerales bacterium]